MEKYDLVILLGSQVLKQDNQYVLARHTQLKAQATVIASREGIAEKFIISGGGNFWVRYDENEILPKADFSFEAFVRGRNEKSEAEVIRDYMKSHGVLEKAMFLEELSATTKENALIIKILLERTTFDFAKRVAILTLAYHMERALPVFQEAGLNIQPLFTEDVLALEGKPGVDKVCQYYSVPKGGKQWDTTKIEQLLSSGRSIRELTTVQ
ncbi:MAG: YdcF family protein [Candidatus Paceibacterales bacterium]